MPTRVLLFRYEGTGSFADNIRPFCRYKSSRRVGIVKKCVLLSQNGNINHNILWEREDIAQ